MVPSGTLNKIHGSIASTYSPDAIKIQATKRPLLRTTYETAAVSAAPHMPHHYRTYTCGRRRSYARRSARRRGSAWRAVRGRAAGRALDLGGRVRRLHLPSIIVVALFVALLVIVMVVLDPSLHLDDEGGLRDDEA